MKSVERMDRIAAGQTRKQGLEFRGLNRRRLDLFMNLCFDPAMVGKPWEIPR